MFGFLNRPFPSFSSAARSLRMSLIAALMVGGILFGLQPFGLDAQPPGERWRLALWYGAATGLACLLFTLALPRWLPRRFDERRWTVGREIFFFMVMLFFVAVANMAVNYGVQGNAVTLQMGLQMFGYTVLVGLAPITASVLLKQQVLLRRYAHQAARINQMLPPPAEGGYTANKRPAGAETAGVQPPFTPSAILPYPAANMAASHAATAARLILHGDNQTESLQLHPAQWLAAEASDNYCRIYYLVPEGQIRQVLFRTTLKKLEEQLANVAGLYRCHKSYLVNLNQVSHISGNAQGYRLHLHHGPLQVPVSRSLNAGLKQMLLRPPVTALHPVG